ncbi:MAG TPA: flagellar biosynthesis protein FlhB [Thermogutta sp.]|nr:flagellar biosynthesis protein FlhB [Thermogutta sp.]HPU05442.1 flagellar biosynthesis protein FlhB [Thermogutta sp.]HPZ82023.1 flagellar biosynthesis protein FlhB [Thermogutta sp.]
MPDQAGERTIEPTQHRRQKAREEGHVAHSADLVSAIVLLSGTLALFFFGRELSDFFFQLTKQFLGEVLITSDSGVVTALLTTVAQKLAIILGPILLAIIAASIAAHFVQFGFLFLPQKLAPDITRIDPLKGFQKIFSLANLVRLGFGILKMLAVGTVAAVYLLTQFDTILGLSSLVPVEIAAYIVELLIWTTIRLGIALLVLAILDFGFQYWKREQDLKMTPQEFREEMRNLEGDPQIAARRKVVQRQLMLNRVNQAVPKADVVVTNPTELAVALQYIPEKMAAPIVVAKGAGLVAQRIRRLAEQHGVPVIEKKPLAQALYRTVEVNQPIPQELYAAVAEVLAYVYHLKGKKPSIPKAA